MSNVLSYTSDIVTPNLNILEQVKNITSLTIEFKGVLDEQKFKEMLRNGEVFKNECYIVDGATYIGDICIDDTGYDNHEFGYKDITSNSMYPYRSLRSYTCTHCGGTIDSDTMHCMYCGVKYFLC